MSERPISERWDEWKDLPAEELQRRRKVLAQREEGLTAMERRARLWEEDLFAEQERVRAKMVVLEQLIERLAAERVQQVETGLDVLRADYRALMALHVERRVGKDVPLFSETGLYDTVGKDLARTVLNRMRELGRDLGIAKDELP